MDKKTAIYNAGIIYNNPNATFILGKDEKLTSISSWNILGRAVEWIKDRASGRKRSESAQKAIISTLEVIEKNMQSFDLTLSSKLPTKESIQENFLFPELPNSFFDRHFALERYRLPMNKLVDKIAASSLAQNSKIKELNDKISKTFNVIDKKISNELPLENLQEIFFTPYWKRKLNPK